MSSANAANPVDTYIEQFPPARQERLRQVRQIICTAAPQAEEKISYGMPTYYWRENLVHFARQKHHLGFYPTPSAIDAFRHQLSPYKTSKGAVQFPDDVDLPLDLIREIVLFRLAEVTAAQPPR